MNSTPLQLIFEDPARGLGSGEQDYLLMYAIARAYQVQRIVEVGTHKGASALMFCRAVLDNHQVPHLWTIDSWESGDRKKEATELFAATGITRYVTMLDGRSDAVLPQLFKTIGTVDLCFLDGDHTGGRAVADYQACKIHAPLLLFHGARADGVKNALRLAAAVGWHVVNFPTRYVEGDGHDIGIALAHA